MISTLLLTHFAICLSQAWEIKAPMVQVEQGALEGTYLTSRNGRQYMAFQGIPYAQPPVGNLRFKDPEPPKIWKGIWNAKEPGSACLQFQRIHTPSQQSCKPIVGDEDCLYLNIYTPKLPTKAENSLLDVFVYIHGGAFMYGWGHEYSTNIILDRDVVFVTINYRVGPLGFLTTEDDVLPGNMGLKDQNAALKWIKKNIKKFGGNPHSITLTGTSAGGASTHYHLLSPMSRGLFTRAISQSGTALCPWPLMEEGKAKTKKLAILLGCPTKHSKELVECLQNRPAHQIVRQVTNFQVWQYNPFSPFAPSVEVAGSNPFLTKTPMDALLDGDVQNIPWITSVTTEDGLYPLADWLEKEQFMAELMQNFKTLAPHLLDYNYTVSEEQKPYVIKQIIDHYFQSHTPWTATGKELIQLFGDRLFIVDAARAAKIHAAISSAPVYFYLFGYRGKHSFSEMASGKATNYGVSHLDDTAYILQYAYSTNETQEDTQMSNLLLDIWTTFAKTGFPAPSGTFTWNPVTPNSKNLDYLYIKSPTTLVMEKSDNLGEQAFWDMLPINEQQIGKRTPINRHTKSEL